MTSFEDELTRNGQELGVGLYLRWLEQRVEEVEREKYFRTASAPVLNSEIERCRKLWVEAWQLLGRLQDERVRNTSEDSPNGWRNGIEDVREQEYIKKARDDYFQLLKKQ
jgi:hypothetical protein